MTDALHSELARLTELAVRACGASPTCRDYTRTEIETALAEIFAGYPTYRTYLSEASPRGDRSRAHRRRRRPPRVTRGPISIAICSRSSRRARVRDSRAAEARRARAHRAAGDRRDHRRRATRTRALSPGPPARALRGRRRAATVRASPDGDPPSRSLARPRASLLATSTHDTKRSEDVRARIAVLSEMPDVWAGARAALARARRSRTGTTSRPIASFEYAMWQTLVGAWPLPLDRAQACADKATREARLRTSWRRPDAAYERRARSLARQRLRRPRARRRDRTARRRELAPHGDRNSLAQLLVKLTAPGVPDFYQGSRAARRQPRRSRQSPAGRSRAARARLAASSRYAVEQIDAAERSRRAQAVADPPRARAAAHPRRPRTSRSWRSARTRTACSRSCVARRSAEAITVVPRLGVRAAGWADTTLALPHGAWRDALSDRTHTGTAPIAELWRVFPVALLIRVDRR